MKVRELIVGVVTGLLLGLAVVAFLVGPAVLSGAQPGAPVEQWTVVVTGEPGDPTPGDATPASPVTEAVADSVTPSPTPPPTQVPPTPTPTLVPLAEGALPGADRTDVVLLYDSAQVSPFHANFCLIAEYYGALCRRIALDSAELSAGDLLDEVGEPLRLIGIAAGTLLSEPPLLSADELSVLNTAVVTDGASLLVAELRPDADLAPLSALTDGALQGVGEPEDSNRDWRVSAAVPEISREFSGQVITPVLATAQGDFALVLDGQAPATVIVSSDDDAGAAYAVFARVARGAGSVFLDAAEAAPDLGSNPLADVYYDRHYFSSIVPLMATMRYALGDEAWHNDQNYANLTIDDPALTEPWEQLSFPALLRELDAHDYHATIALPPVAWEQSQPEVVALFLERPDRLSIVQHGNNTDGYEFYRYEVTEEDEYNGQHLPARPLAEQEADIVEGLTRMAQHRGATGIRHGEVMIFPWNIAPEPTLVLLKKYNYLATVNAWDVPLDAAEPPAWDHGMYQANLQYGNFATLGRWCFTQLEDLEPRLPYATFDLFVDKPALFCTHAYEHTALGQEGMGAFNPVADRLNALWNRPEWQGLGYILRRLYLQRVADDGGVTVKFYTNHLIVSNESGEDRTYHLQKAETLNVPLAALTVNGHEFPYRVDGGLLSLDVVIPAGTSATVRLHYGGD